MFPKLSETFVTNHIISLLRRGHNVTVFALSRAEQTHHLDVAKYRLLDRTVYAEHPRCSLPLRLAAAVWQWSSFTVRSPATSWGSLQLAFPFDSKAQLRLQLARCMSQHKLDLLHCHFGPQGVIAARINATRSAPLPIITSFHGCDLGNGIDRTTYHELFRSGAVFIANSRFTASRLADLGCPIDHLHIVPVGVNVNDIPFAERHWTNGESLRLLTVARLVPFKGLHYAIEAVGRLSRNGLDVRYDIVGDGPLRQELQTIIDRQALTNRVQLRGPMTRDQVLIQYRQAHAFVLPSVDHEGRSETQGLVLQEAQAAGLPVLASASGGIPEGIRNNITGYLFPPGDIDALVACVERLVAERDRWTAMSRAGRRFIEEHYDNDQIVQRLEEIYRISLSLPWGNQRVIE